MTTADGHVTDGSVDNLDISIRAQVTIMIVTTIIEFACGFGLIALAIASWIDIIDGEISIRQMLALPLSFALTFITGYKAMMLVCRPTHQGMALVAVLAVASIFPILALEF
ncbi:hypothetical protein BH10PSE13_BH10PSE13_13740 [soil metagenome]